MAVAPVTSRQKEKNSLYPSVSVPEIPSLENGDHLTREEFERRYDGMPHLKKAELVEGRVYMTSAVKVDHSESHASIITWLGMYRAATPGIRLHDNGTVRMDEENELQPDASLRIESRNIGTSRVSDDNYMEGSPEFIVEVAGSSASYDLHEKMQIYQRHGVREYLVWQLYENRLDWFELQEGKYVALTPDAKGIVQSRVFPGLHLAVDALLAENLAEVLTVLQRGLHTDEHTAFVEALKAG
jgi:Uma2 family endonuclease